MREVEEGKEDMWKVILVEDEDLLREGLTQFVDWKGLGFEIAGEAENGLQGLQLAKEICPEVVFTDIRMPGMDGIAMTEQIKQLYPQTVVVILSGYDEFEYARQAVRLGVTDYLLKPVEPEQVEALMRRISAELTDRRKKQHNLAELQEMRQHSIRELRNKWIAETLFENQTDQETETLDHLLKGQMEELFFVAGILEWEDFPTKSIYCDYLQTLELDRKFEEEVQKRIGKLLLSGEVGLFHRNSGEYVVVLFNTVREALLDQTQSFQKGIRKRKAFESEFLLNLGTLQKGREGLVASFNEAKKKRENSYLKRWDSQGKAGSIGYVDKRIQVMQYDATPVIRAISEGNHEKLKKEFAAFSEAMARARLQSQIQLMYVIRGFYNEIAQLPQEIGMSFEETIGNPMDYYSEIVRKSQISHVMEELQKVCEKVTDLFSSSQASQAKVSFRRAVEYMECEYKNSELVMSEVAQFAFVSNTYLGMILKKETGKTFIEYLTEIRVRHAKELLHLSDLKNYEVAEACGFSDATYFSTVFKKVCGLSPSAYRKRKVF